MRPWWTRTDGQQMVASARDRLRADLALAAHARTRLVECGHEATLRRYDALLEQCRAEHLDGDEAERLRNAAYPKLEVPW